MYCEVHERPKDLDCDICGMPLCKECAEFVEGGWLCHDCARRERHAVLFQFDAHYREMAAAGGSAHSVLEE